MPSNKPFSLLLITFLLFTFTTAFAQFPGMGAVRTQMNNQFRDQQSRMFAQGMTLRGANYSYNKEVDYLVTMLDGSQKTVHSSIYIDTTTNKNYLEVVDKILKKTDTNRIKRIYPAQTLSIGRDLAILFYSDDPRHKTYFTGMAKDSCWMFKVETGAINAYSYLSEHPGTNFNPYSIVGIQLGDGPIIKYTVENLKVMVGDNINALELIQRENNYRAIKRFNKDVANDLKKKSSKI